MSDKEWQLLYEEELTPYKFVKDNDINPDLADYENIDTGYKCHLNVALQDVKSVSKYLKDNGFFHKYLSASDEAVDGKIFTVYFGSLNKVKQGAVKLSDEIDHLLCKPFNDSGVEMAPNVAARFHCAGADLARYPRAKVRGIPTLIKFDDYDEIWNKADQATTLQAFKESYQAIADRYGSYFSGE